MSDVLACVSVHYADQRQHPIPDFLTKYMDNTLQSSVDIANEHLQAYNTGAVVKSHIFCSMHQCIVQDIQCFCLHLFSLTNILENKIKLST